MSDFNDSSEKASSSVGHPLTDGEILYYRAAARRGFVWLFSTTLVWQIFSWICTLLTVRILRPEDYGLVALPDAIFPYLMMITTLRLDTWMMQVGKLDEKAEEALLSLLTLLALLCTGLGFIAAPFLASFYGYPELELVAQVMCLMFFPRSLRLIPEVRLRRELQVKPIAVSNLVIGVFRGLIQVYLASRGWGAWALILGAIGAEFGLLLWLGIVAGMPKRFGWDTDLCREACRFGASATSSTVFWVIFSTADNLVVGKLFGKEALGYYATAFLLTDLPLSKINTVIAPVLYPYYSKLKHNPLELSAVFIRTNKTLVGLIAPALAGLAVVAPEFVPLAFGEQWTPMILPLQVMCAVGILRALTANVTSFLFALGQPNRVLWTSIVTALVLPFCFYFLGVQFGMLGIYLSWLLVYPIVGPYLMFRQIAMVTGRGVGEFAQNFIPTIISVLALLGSTALVAFLLREQLGASGLLALEVALGALVYVCVYRQLFPADFRDALQLLRGLRGPRENEDM